VSRPIARRPRLWAAAALVAVACGLLAFQPLRSPWWSGYDYDTVYVASGLTLFRGERSLFYDHPGAPLQEAMAATFTAAWALSGDGDRGAKADAWLRDLDSTRPYLRVWGSLLAVVAALIVFLSVAWVFRGALWGLVAGLVFLGSPDVIVWEAVVKPDPLLAALSIAAVALAVEGFRRRSAPLYLASAFVIGYDVSVKLQAAGLVVPLALAVLMRPPAPGWWRDSRRVARDWVARHRRTLLVAGAVWALVVLVLNALAAPPALRPLAQLLAGLAALTAAGVVGHAVLRRTRVASLAGLALALLVAGLAGMIVPNLFYLSMPAPMVRQVAITLTGGGVNEGANPSLNPVDVLEPWWWLALLAAAGLVLALRAGDRTALLWAAGALAMGFLAFLRFGYVYYYTSAIALLAPLAILALRPLVRRPAGLTLVALLVALVLLRPFDLGIDAARDRGAVAEETHEVNRWVAARMEPGEVAVSRLESTDSRYFHLVHFYAPHTPEPDYRFLPPDGEAARHIAEQGLRVRYLVMGADEDPAGILATVGVQGTAERVDAPGVVYRVAG
jgi:hypothetical protein